MTTERLLELGLLAVGLSSFWVVFVLAVRVAVTRWLGARWAYYLWLVPLLGLLAMAVPSQPVQRVLNVPGIEVPVVNSVIDTASGMFSLASKAGKGESQIAPAHYFDMPALILGTWALGFLLFFLVFSVRSFKSSKGMYNASNVLSAEQNATVRMRCAPLAHRFSDSIRILSSNHGPAVVGLPRQVLYLPANFFQRYSSQQQILMLEHEYQHLERRDLIGLALARIYRCLFWFNPLVYIAESYLRLDQELSVDEKVLAASNRTTRRLYGETLVLSAQAEIAFAQVSYSPSYGHIKQRTQMLRHYHGRTAGQVLGGLLLISSVSVSIAYGVLGVLEFRPELEFREVRVLDSKAKIQFEQKNYIETVKTLIQMERISPASLSAENLALRSQALVKLHQWGQGLRYINRAIVQSETDGEIPKQDWLLVQTALEWKLGDLPAAAFSLERSIEFYPETTYEDTLIVLNEMVQDVWEPIVNDGSLAQL